MTAAYRTNSFATSGSRNSFTSINVSLGAAAVAGDRIVVTILIANSTGSSYPAFTVTDNLNAGAYTQDATATYIDGANYTRFAVYSHANSAAGTPAVNVAVSPANGTFGGMCLVAYSGLLASDPGTDVAVATHGTTTGTVSSGATAATTAASELVVGAFGDLGEGTTLGAGTLNGSATGVTLRGKHDTDGTYYQGLIEDVLASGASGTTQTFTVTGAGIEWGIGCVVYKPLAGGPTTYPITVSTTQSQTLSLIRGVRLVRTNTQTQTLSVGLVHSGAGALTLSATQAESVSLRRVVTLARTVTVTDAPYSLSALKSVHLTVSLTQTQSATVAFVVRHTYSATLTATQTQSLSITLQLLSHPFATQVSTNGRYLLDQYGHPYFMQGSSPQAMCTALSAANMQTFFADQAGRGVNSCQVHLVLTSNFDSSLPTDGHNLTTLQAPFSNLATLTGPNPAYWSLVDQMFSLAQQYGITVHANPAENYTFSQIVPGCTTTQLQAYGTFIGNRYKALPNIVWNFGNDWQAPYNNDSQYQTILSAMRAAGDTHLVTTLMNYPESTSWILSTWDALHTIVQVYSYGVSYWQTEVGYTHAGTTAPQPVFFGEGNYDGENVRGYGVTNETLRRTAWWSVTWGGCGQFYGQHLVWNFLSGWQTMLGDAAAVQMSYVGSLMQSFSNWQLLVPDASHALITSGYGTHDTTGSAPNPVTNDFATAAISSDNTLAVIYVPTVRTWTLNTGMLTGGTPIAIWYDPTTGAKTTAAAPYTIPAAAHADGTHDWVLILQSPPPPVTYTITRTITQAQTVSLTQRAQLVRGVTEPTALAHRLQDLSHVALIEATSVSVTTIHSAHTYPLTVSLTQTQTLALILARSSPPHPITVSASQGQSLSVSLVKNALLTVLWDPSVGVFRTSGTGYATVGWPGGGGQFEPEP